jgi:type I restriction enzyme, S subunit
MSFKYIPFTHLLSNIVDNRGKTCPTSLTGIPLIATNCIHNNNLYPTYEKVRYVSQETYKIWFRGHPKPGDLIFVTKGTPGRVCVAPNPVDFCIAQDMLAIRADDTKIYPRFLFAALRSIMVQREIENMHVGTLIPHFKKGDFDKLHIPVPDTKTQQVIGDIYFTISQKIELNQKMNQTLEAMAQAIFKSWFVDFDPVRAKMAGQQPVGMDKATAALFPDSIEDSVLGEIPQGWRHDILENVVNLNETTIKKDYPYQEIQYVDISSVTVGRLEGVTNYLLSNAPGRARRLVKHGDTIWSGVRPNRKSYLFIHNPDNNLVVSTGFIVLSPSKIPPSYLYSFVTTDDFVDYLTFNADGSAYPAVRVDRFADAVILIPSNEILEIFERNVGKMRDKIAQNEKESQTLSTLRDTLLPKLISGELRVPEADRQIAELV